MQHDEEHARRVHDYWNGAARDLRAEFAVDGLPAELAIEPMLIVAMEHQAELSGPRALARQLYVMALRLAREADQLERGARVSSASEPVPSQARH